MFEVDLLCGCDLEDVVDEDWILCLVVVGGGCCAKAEIEEDDPEELSVTVELNLGKLVVEVLVERTNVPVVNPTLLEGFV